MNAARELIIGACQSTSAAESFSPLIGVAPRAYFVLESRFQSNCSTARTAYTTISERQ
jgi:hypothetical protein